LPVGEALAFRALDRRERAVGVVEAAAFEADFRSRRAVERCIEIVSEASRHIPDAEKACFPDLPWSDIVGSGDLFRHADHQGAAPVVWRTAARSLSELRPVIEAMFARARARP